MTDQVKKQYEAAELFVIVPVVGDEAIAGRVTCKLCGDVLFDRQRDGKDRLEAIFHGLRFHFELSHGITLNTNPGAEAKCTERHS